MERMTVREMLRRIVVETSALDIEHFYIVATDGDAVEAEFAVDLIQKVAEWNFLSEVYIIAAKQYRNHFTVIFTSDVEQVNGDPDKGDTWL